MKTCEKDCWHYEKCEMWLQSCCNGDNAEQCEAFTDKSIWVCMPCAIGTKCYRIEKCCHANDYISEKFKPNKVFHEDCPHYFTSYLNDRCELYYCSKLYVYSKCCEERLIVVPHYFEYLDFNKMYSPDKEVNEETIFLTPESALEVIEKMKRRGKVL